ncbi:MAG: hypothetical protein HQM02_11200 [Magnetococcales bacterium]|nr:hypothetical protein [Magnetococcales bacterium]
MNMTVQPEWVSWLVLIGGGGLVLFGFLKIIVSSARLMVWMVLLVVGLGGMAYGIRAPPAMLDALGVPGATARTIRSMVAPHP